MRVAACLATGVLLVNMGCRAQAGPPAEAKAMPCPGTGAAIELTRGQWSLADGCTVSGLSLRGEAQLWVEDRTFTVDGNIILDEGAGLHIRGGVFTIANKFKFQYRIVAKGKTLMEIADAKVSTNAGVTANLTSNYQGSDDSLLRMNNVQTDKATSWMLVNLKGRARLETKDSSHIPGEIYPSENATVRIEGPKSGHQIWLRFNAGAEAVLDGLPENKPFTFSFGRNTPGVVGVGYQVDIVNGSAGFSVTSMPGSKVTVKDSHVGVGYEFADVTSPETISGLKGGEQTAEHPSQGRVFDLVNATLPPYGWQLYSSNAGIPVASAKPVTVKDALVNEMGAAERGWFEAEHVQFAFAAVAAQGPGSRVTIRDSTIESHTIMANNDGVMTIEDSEIYGSRLQAIGRSRILILNSALKFNEPSAKCVPQFPSLDGKPRTKCNPYNPSHEVTFVTQGAGLVVVAGIEELKAPVRIGAPVEFVGDALVKGSSSGTWKYALGYKSAQDAGFVAIVSDGTPTRVGAPLGTLETRNLMPGDYVLQLRLIEEGHEPVTVERHFTLEQP